MIAGHSAAILFSRTSNPAMYYFIPLCVAVMLRGSVALGGCNDTCSSILAGKSSGNFDVDCNAGITTDYFKCISAISGCDNITKSTIAEQSIAKYYPSITACRSRTMERLCGHLCVRLWMYLLDIIMLVVGESHQRDCAITTSDIVL